MSTSPVQRRPGSPTQRKAGSSQSPSAFMTIGWRTKVPGDVAEHTGRPEAATAVVGDPAADEGAILVARGLRGVDQPDLAVRRVEQQGVLFGAGRIVRQRLGRAPAVGARCEAGDVDRDVRHAFHGAREPDAGERAVRQHMQIGCMVWTCGEGRTASARPTRSRSARKQPSMSGATSSGARMRGWAEFPQGKVEKRAVRSASAASPRGISGGRVRVQAGLPVFRPTIALMVGIWT